MAGNVTPNSSRIRTVGDLVRSNARQYGDRIAFRDGSRALSFVDFATRAASLQSALAQLGVSKGDRVAILCRNRIEIVEIYAASDGGTISVPINWRLGDQEIAKLLRGCRPSMVIAEDEYAVRIETMGAALPPTVQRVIVGAERSSWMEYEELIRLGEEGRRSTLDRAAGADPACIIYTSGTTGSPKGAVLTHTGLLANCSDDVAETLGLGPDEVTLSVMPLFHVGAMWYHLFPSFAAGATTIILRSYSPDAVLTAIDRHRVTNVHLVPTMVADLIERPGAAESAKSLKLFYYAASPMPASLLRRAMKCFAGCAFVQGYGSTEGGSMALLTAADHARAVSDPAAEKLLFSCGRPMAGVNLRLLDTEGRDAAPGAIGEIVVHSPKRMAGYWDNPAMTAEVLRGDWLHTGDLARLDSDGYISIIDRKSDMIISGGENVYPFEVEQVLYAMPEIVEAAVIGLPDSRWIERVVACVVPRTGAAILESDVIGYVRDKLAAYKCPKQVIFMDLLPKSAVGKILKKELRAKLAATTATQP